MLFGAWRVTLSCLRRLFPVRLPMHAGFVASESAVSAISAAITEQVTHQVTEQVISLLQALNDGEASTDDVRSYFMLIYVKRVCKVLVLRL